MLQHEGQRHYLKEMLRKCSIFRAPQRLFKAYSLSLILLVLNLPKELVLE